MIRAGTFLPELSHVSETEGDSTFVTTTGRMGAIFECPIIDLESREIGGRVGAIERLIESLPDGVTLRVTQRADASIEVEEGTFRSEAIRQVGHVGRRLLLSFEQNGVDPLSLRRITRRLRGTPVQAAGEPEGLLRSLPRHELVQLRARPLTADRIETEFALPQAEVSVNRGSLDFGSHLTSVVRLYKPGSRAIGEGTLASILDELPLPFEIVVSVNKVSRRRADFRLRSQLARGAGSADPASAARQEATAKALEETSLYGGTLCEVEWLLVLGREDEATLRRDLEKARSVLAPFGEVMIETIGAVPSYIASRIGSTPHFSFLEEGGAVPFYLPAFSFGEGVQGAANARTLLLHRLDGSLHRYDHFSERFLAYNAIISGKAGSGKSVLANALSSALLQDPSVRMIKTDVGGSYKKECEAFGGSEVSFRLDAPSGVNPFRIFRDVSNLNDAVEIVTEFLATLIREEGEKQIQKGMRAQIEERLKAYVSRVAKSSGGGGRPSLDHFLELTPDFPRRTLLARWATGGVFENVLKERPGEVASGVPARYRYYNFENIHSAASRDFAEGAMAAVITMVNLEMLRLGDRSKGQAGDRLVLVCDEMKFFVERFSSFFLLTSANFRKFGHGLTLIFQNIRDAEIQLPDGKADRGLILNSPIRFFLQADTEADYLRDQFQFEDHHLEAVVKKPHRGRDFREAVLQDDTGTRVVRLYLTDGEYWRMTSKKEDVDKFNKLRHAVPELSVEEAIQCLALCHGR